jgi:hypothetical protein
VDTYAKYAGDDRIKLVNLVGGPAGPLYKKPEPLRQALSILAAKAGKVAAYVIVPDGGYYLGFLDILSNEFSVKDVKADTLYELQVKTFCEMVDTCPSAQVQFFDAQGNKIEPSDAGTLH